MIPARMLERPSSFRLWYVTPVGNDVPATWTALLAGRSGAAPISSFDASAFPTTFACEVKGFDPKAYVPNRKALKIMGKNVQFALAAAQEALRDAGVLLPGGGVPGPERAGVVFGAGIVNATLPDLVEAIPACSLGGRFRL